MTSPARIPSPKAEKQPSAVIERARRGQPDVQTTPASDEETVDVRAWARQVVAVALEIEGVETSTICPVTADPEAL